MIDIRKIMDMLPTILVGGKFLKKIKNGNKRNNIGG